MLDEKGNNEVAEGKPLMMNASNTNSNLATEDGDDGQPKKLLIRQTAWRWLMLTFGCFFLMGSYFCFDNPGALQKEIKDAMGISTYQFSQLYAWYSWPNVILPIVGGYLMDSVFGIRLGTVIFASFIILGKFNICLIRSTFKKNS